MTQKADVIEYLQKHGSITTMQAFSKFGITRLARVVFELVEEGFIIPRETIEVRDRHGRKCRVTQYQRPTVWP